MTEFCCSTKLYTGTNALSALKNYPARRVMLVTDQFFSQSGTAQRITSMFSGAESLIFDQVTPDPSADLAARATAECRKFRPEVLVALGGGSPMDCAKAVRLAAENPMTFIAIPTTSGSGSEVTAFSILTHDGVKHPLVDPVMRPDAAILDESLVAKLPLSLVADTGMDLLAHCVEAVCARGRNGFTDALACHAAGRVFSFLHESWKGENGVRMAVHEAAAMAGVAFDNAGLGLCHALAHSLGGVFHLPHGRLCAMLLPHVIAYNEACASEAYTMLAKACGIQTSTRKMAVRSLSAAISRLRQSLQLPGSLTQAGLSAAELAAAKEAVVSAALADPCCGSNPAPVTEAGVVAIYEAVSR